MPAPASPRPATPSCAEQTLHRLKNRSRPRGFRRRPQAPPRPPPPGSSRRVLKDGSGLEAVARAAEQARERVAGWQIDRDGFRASAPGSSASTRAAAAPYKLAQPGAHADLFHEWRKQVKNLWHQLEILEPIWPEVMKKLADECHELADALGQDHDLAVLRDVLEAEAPTPAGEPSPLLQAIESAPAPTSGAPPAPWCADLRRKAEGLRRSPQQILESLAGRSPEDATPDETPDAPEIEADAPAVPTDEPTGVEAGGAGTAETGAAVASRLSRAVRQRARLIDKRVTAGSDLGRSRPTCTSSGPSPPSGRGRGACRC